MQFCTDHWAQLREAIEKRGLGHLIAENGQQAMGHMVRELQGENTVVDFEPLLGSHNILVSAATHYFNPIFVMTLDEAGNHRCPVCLLQSLNWIEWVSEGALGEAQRRGLVASPDPTPGSEPG